MSLRHISALLFGVGLLTTAPLTAWSADDPPESEKKTTAPRPGHDEPKGTWKFKTGKPVGVVVLGGSVAAYMGENFGDALEKVCSQIEVRNIAKTGYGAWALKKRFQAQVLKNRRLRNADPTKERWLVFHGGLNSVGTPEKTNAHIRDTFVLAHKAGFQVAGLSLTPWGAEHDKRRWKGIRAIRYREATQKAVDFMLGKLSPGEALGHRASSPEWMPGELPDIGVDLYDSPLRSAATAPRDRARIERAFDRSSRWKKHLRTLPEENRSAERERLIGLAVEAPRHFLRKELQAFDHIHPNRRGHRLMAATACPELPESWNCDCAALLEESP